MIHPNTEVRYINNEKGYGLFATREIPRGTITWTLDHLDRVITQEVMEQQDHRYREILMKYSFRNNRGDYIFCWDNGRFINHSFNSNCCLTPYNLEIAIRDIAEGEEITDDYGYLNIIEPFEANADGGDRSVVYPDDLLRYADIWDEKIKAAFPALYKVEQPLKVYIEPGISAILEDIKKNRCELLSISTCYFDPINEVGVFFN